MFTCSFKVHEGSDFVLVTVELSVSEMVNVVGAQ